MLQENTMCHKLRYTVYRWFRKHEISGVESYVKQKNSKYTDDFKIHVVEYMHTNRLSTLETALKFLMSSDTQVRWKQL